jgi:CRISPR/Cas system-associated exonuclease Cas4 (RecB family)
MYGDRLSRFCIVFPNIRAGLFFRKYLAELSAQPLWSPAFRSVNALFEELTGWKHAERIAMVFDLWQAYRACRLSEESFEAFYFWGEMLLNDFDDVDKSLTDARDLFRNVSDLKEIDVLFDYLTREQKEAIRMFWRDFGDGKTPMKDTFSLVWSSLHAMYVTFKQRLRDKSVGYEGMLQREAVERIRRGEARLDAYEKYVFIGFNALTACEKRFFKTLQQSGKAIFFWDTDNYYLDNKWHEAGVFLRDNVRQFPSEQQPDKKPFAGFCGHIEVISVPSETGQAEMMAQILDALPNDTDWSRVAVALPDEHMLLPVLSSLPAKIKDVNITMGYPFVYSLANSLFERLALLRQRLRNNAGVVWFYHRDVDMILHHPYVQRIVGDDAGRISRSLIQLNCIYVEASELAAHSLLRKIFRECSNPGDFTAYLMEIVSEIAGNIRKDGGELSVNDRYAMEYLYTLHIELQKIDNILTGNDIHADMPMFIRLVRQVLASVKIPFNGEPLKGLQVMGMLETRALDFDTVIILSMNEGIFPAPHHFPSFIPYHLRKGFGLSVSEHQDCVSAYCFYRLMQHAANVKLIYNSAATSRNSGEVSRFITQMRYEPDVFNVSEYHAPFRIRPTADAVIVKERTEKVRKILDLYLSEGENRKMLSPSALNTYLDCPLRFFFRYIDELKEPEEPAQEIEPNDFGKLLHSMMEQLYLPHTGKMMEPADIRRIADDVGNIRRTLLKAFSKEYFHKNINDSDISGRNIIIREVLMKYVGRILEVDEKAAPFTILSVEKKLHVRIPAGNRQVNMYGVIDRLEQTSKGLRIIDYKTGSAGRNFAGVVGLFDRYGAGNHAAMQTLVYARMVHADLPEQQHICPGLYVTKELFAGDYDPRLYIPKQLLLDNYFSIAGEFEKELDALLAEIFLGEQPFIRTNNEKKCQNCPYAEICHRG